ncbi:MAG: hypothetical protein AB7O91_02015 [Sphingomonas sp.]
MRQYRYRTSVLTGRWRDRYEDAVADAARARQLVFDVDKPGDYRWSVPGQIEQRGEKSAKAVSRA